MEHLATVGAVEGLGKLGGLFQMVVQVTFEGVKMKEEEEGIKAVVDLEKEDLEEMEIIKTEVKVGLEEAKVKEGLMGLEGDEAKEVAVGMEMVKNLRRT